MRADAEILVLEDDPQELQRVQVAMTRAGLPVLPASTPDTALAILPYRKPVLAVIDLDMSKAADSERTVNDVLSWLYEWAGECMVIVYSSHVGTIEQQEPVYAIHPYVLFQDKKDGDHALIQRIERLLAARFGDLAISRGKVRHGPSGRMYPHRVAVSLLMAKRIKQPLYLDDTDARAARRFNRWLHDQVGSQVRVMSHRDHRYELVLERAS
jgi:CheY-like chemotaxis protein